MAFPDPQHTRHEKWMARCLELACRGAGQVSPNPLVGSVLIGASGTLLGEGWHQRYGGPHAELNAIEAAETMYGAGALKTATLYVNLEPCSHFGKTPPCSNLILEKEIPHVVIGMIDPNEQVSGRGINRLRERGVEVCVGVLQAACMRLNEAFSHHQETGRPLVTLKIAQTLDGRVSTTTGDARWISGEASRKLVHRWRASVDAVLVGNGTARSDNPALTVRHVAGRQPHRVVLDREGVLPKHLALFTDAYAGKTIAMVDQSTNPAYAHLLQNAGGTVLKFSTDKGHLNLHQVLRELGTATQAHQGFQSILVEAGPRLATALFAHDLVDRFFLFIAPKIVGDGTPTLEGLSVEKMQEAHAFAETRWERVGDDMLFRGYRRRF